MPEPRWPETFRGPSVELLHGERVEDPYRWLEDPDSAETRDWVVRQNRASRSYLDALAPRPWFADHLVTFVNRRRAGTPAKAGRRYLRSCNDGSMEQDQVYVADDLDELGAGGRLLLDPNEFSPNGGSSLVDQTVSRDGTLLAYLVSHHGSDWTSIRLQRLDGTAPVPPFETVEDVKYSSATWLPDRSFLYSHYDVNGERNDRATAALLGRKLKRHRVGTPQHEDEVVLEFPDDPRLGMTAEVSHDGRWLVVSIRRGTSKQNRLWVYPLATRSGRLVVTEPLKVIDTAYAAFDLVRVDGEHMYLRTDHEAPFGRIVRTDLSKVAGSEPAFEVVVPQGTTALRQAVGAGNEILTVHLVDAQPVLTRNSLDGAELAVVPLEGGAIVALNARSGDPEVFVGMNSVSSPLTSYRIDLRDGSVLRIDDPTPTGNEWKAPRVSSERRRAVSADGTAVPYFLFHRRDLALDRPRATMLYGKGGFRVPALNQFRPAFSAWLAAGGVLAIANLRGGGEYDAAWYDAGRRHHKQNVFDDFIAVAERLIADGVTTSAQLALHGGSNGGLTVAAAITQRPELAAAALPSVGLMDMLRYHLFTVGAAWADEYGSPEDPADFGVLRAYSPLHNLPETTALPATLVLTSDHDDRVVPAHSLKFTAAAQHAQAGTAPVLARIGSSTGHAHGKAASVVVAENADLLSFAAAHTGLSPRSVRR